ncbi:MAG: carbamoyl-phosphate synthase large subunit [Bdellovibrionales bacterium]|nr:carbamoyl-phosphate synthase large subunit [Bdellovibrionales bacterium]
MPLRKDLSKVLIIGSGPIVIGQACEFDYSGTQAVKALREEGLQVVLVNSNPATIMTDPETADRVYIEPLTPEFLERILELEKPDAVLPTMGGQTALNLALELEKRGVFKRLKIELLGAKPEAIRLAEDRELFKAKMEELGLNSARSVLARSLEDGKKALKEFGLPLILRPSFTLGGEGGGAVHTEEEFLKQLERALFLSPTGECLVEESLLGWKEFELEVVRDGADNVVIVCSIENLDPMGVHTGDSITIAPAQTLTDREFQNLRDQSIRIIRAIGVETGGSNIQFAINPRDGRVVVIEMNPRVSRSSALASKATGFPIARIAAKLAIGYRLHELTNEITGTTPASFEPSLDYVVTKIPRFDFEKFRPTPEILTTQMKSVGEVMALGRTFEESFGKAIAGLETDSPWLKPLGDQIKWDWIEKAHPRRIWAVADAIRLGASSEEIYTKSGIDPWFLSRIRKHLEAEKIMSTEKFPFDARTFEKIKALGWTDRGIAGFLSHQKKGEISEEQVRLARESAGVYSAFLKVDTCAAEFEAKTPYLYSTYLSKNDESEPSSNLKKVMILGGGPNRIGQGIEFDYCCVHASKALRKMGIETLMVNSNPETVSTDFDISDKLYFEPLTPEHVLRIAQLEKPLGVIVQLGGQTPLKIAKALEAGGLRVLGTSTSSIDLAEDREKCSQIVRELAPLGLKEPPSTIARTAEEAIAKATALGYPVLLRPSYVLGGKGMRIVHSETTLRASIEESMRVTDKHPLLIDRFLDRATEVDVDALSDGKECFIAGLMEHIEEAGIHSGDSACSLPAVTLSPETTDRIRTYTRELARRLRVIGLLNCQFAILGDDIYLLEVNPRASRTVPFVSKAIGKALVPLAVQIMMGKSLHDLSIRQDLDLELDTYHVKAPVFPFHKFPAVDVLLGPEMKSTGEVMGRAHTFPAAYSKAMAGAGVHLPLKGSVFLSIRDQDKAAVLPLAMDLKNLGFELWATKGTAEFLNGYELGVKAINKVKEGSPHCVEAIHEGRFQLVINTVYGDRAYHDSKSMRRAALERKIPYATVLSSARAMLQSIRQARRGPIEILPL